MWAGLVIGPPEATGRRVGHAERPAAKRHPDEGSAALLLEIEDDRHSTHDRMCATHGARDHHAVDLPHIARNVLGLGDATAFAQEAVDEAELRLRADHGVQKSKVDAVSRVKPQHGANVQRSRQ